MPMRRAEGFTLLELLVALAVFSLAALALLNLGGEGARSAAIVESRLLADIVAENRAIESLYQPLAMLQSVREGEDDQGDRAWHWRREMAATEDGLWRIRVQVREAGSRQVVAERELLRTAR